MQFVKMADTLVFMQQQYAEMMKQQAEMLKQIQAQNQQMKAMQEQHNQQMRGMQEKLAMQEKLREEPGQPLRRSESAPPAPPSFRERPLRRSPRKHPGTHCQTPVRQQELKSTPASSKLQRRLSYSSGTDKNKIRKRARDGNEEVHRRKKKRKKKPDDERKLRGDLRERLYVFDQDLVANKYQSCENPAYFDRDMFADACRPIIEELLEDDYEEFGAKAFSMAVDVAKKRRKYLIEKANPKPKDKEKSTIKKVKEEKVIKKVKEEKVIKPEKKVMEPKEKVIIDMADEDQTDSDEDVQAEVDALFDPTDEEDEDQQVSYQCYSCNEHMKSLEQCFPENQRHLSRVMFLCRDCYKQQSNSVLIAQVKDCIQRDEAKKSIENSAASNKSKAKKSAATNKSKVEKSAAANKWKFDLHANVLCKWDGEFYPAQVFGRYKNKYHVYFPDDREVRKNVDAADIKNPPQKPKKPHWAKCDRTRFLQMGFKHTRQQHRNAKHTPEVYGSFSIVKLGKGKTANHYVCKLDGSNKEYNFDMGYVQNLLLGDIFPFAKKELKGKSFFTL